MKKALQRIWASPAVFSSVIVFFTAFSLTWYMADGLLYGYQPSHRFMGTLDEAITSWLHHVPTVCAVSGIFVLGHLLLFPLYRRFGLPQARPCLWFHSITGTILALIAYFPFTILRLHLSRIKLGSSSGVHGREAEVFHLLFSACGGFLGLVLLEGFAFMVIKLSQRRASRRILSP